MKFEIDIRFSGLTANLKMVRIDGNYSKKDEFFRNRSGGWYSLFISRFKLWLGVLLLPKVGISAAIIYKRVLPRLKSWLLGALGSI